MEKIATENLFLLEFLVDSVSLDPKCECDAPPGETCVSFQFLDNAPLDVCEADFNPKRNLKYTKKEETVKSGKSCLFSLSPDQASEATEQFDVTVTVMRRMQPGWLPEKVEIGKSIISISNLFNELIQSVEVSDCTCPTAKTLKDLFDISDTNGTVIGKISVYIRMSCFGKLIVTQFQMNLEDKSVLFKDNEGKSLYRYKKAGKKGRQDPNERGGTFSGGYNASCPQVPCGGRSTATPTDGRQGTGTTADSNDCPFAPCGGANGREGSQGLGPGVSQTPFTPPGNQMYPQMMGGGYPGYPGGGPPGYGQQPMMAPCNECGYPNAPCMPPMGGAMMMGGGGYNDMAMGGPPGPPDGNYQEIGASMGGNSLTIRVHKDKGKAEQVDPNGMDECICGGEVDQKGQSYVMRPGVTPNSPFSFRMGQSGDAQPGHGNVVINPPVCTAPDGTQFTEFSDPNKETFILRIGKKSEGVDKKNNLELELQTPKGPPLKPIPKKETVETQYDLLDAGAEDSGSKGKGKGGKGGKGKGGKGGGKKGKKK